MPGLKATLVLIPAVALACAGCLTTHYTLYLLPDATGKLTIEVEYGKEMREMMVAADSIAAVRDGLSAENIKTAKQWGIVGMTEDRSIPASKGFTATLYFDDINKVRMCTPEDSTCDSPFLKFVLERDGEVTRLVILDQNLTGIAEAVGMGSAGSREDEGFAALVSEMTASFTVTVPGRVTVVEGFDLMDGRRAWVNVDHPRIERAMKASDASQIPTRLSVKWTTKEVSRGEIAAFRKEMADAKAKFVPTRSRAKEHE